MEKTKIYSLLSVADYEKVEKVQARLYNKYNIVRCVSCGEYACYFEYGN